MQHRRDNLTAAHWYETITSLFSLLGSLLFLILTPLAVQPYAVQFSTVGVLTTRLLRQHPKNEVVELREQGARSGIIHAKM